MLYANSLSPFCFYQKYGVIDESRNIILRPVFNDIGINSESYIICKDEINSYYIYSPDIKLRHKTPEQSSLSWYSNYEAMVTFPQNSGTSYQTYIINIRNGKTSNSKTYKDKYLYTPYYTDKFAVVLKKDNLKFSVIDRNGKELFKDFKQAAWNYSEGLLPVIYTDGTSGYINTKGKLVLNVPVFLDYRMGGPKIEHLLNYDFHNDVAFLQTDEDVWHLVDKKGNMKKIPDDYKFPDRRFSNDLVLTEDKDQKFGFMNKNMELTIPCIFDSAESFEGKYAIAVYKGKDAIVDEKGNIYFCEDFCKQKIQER